MTEQEQKEWVGQAAFDAAIEQVPEFRNTPAAVKFIKAYEAARAKPAQPDMRTVRNAIKSGHANYRYALKKQTGCPESVWAALAIPAPLNESEVEAIACAVVSETASVFASPAAQPDKATKQRNYALVAGTCTQPDKAEVVERVALVIFMKLYPRLQWTPGGAAESTCYGIAQAALSTLPPQRDDSGLVEALKVVVGCFEAADAEGLSHRLAEADIYNAGSLADLVFRRLLHALPPAQQALADYAAQAKEKA